MQLHLNCKHPTEILCFQEWFADFEGVRWRFNFAVVTNNFVFFKLPCLEMTENENVKVTVHYLFYFILLMWGCSSPGVSNWLRCVMTPVQIHKWSKSLHLAYGLTYLIISATIFYIGNKLLSHKCEILSEEARLIGHVYMTNSLTADKQWYC